MARSKSANADTPTIVAARLHELLHQMTERLQGDTDRLVARLAK